MNQPEMRGNDADRFSIASHHHNTARREDDNLPAAPRVSVCRRCLLEHMADEQAAYRLVRDWIDALPQDRRADETTYRARLTACAACDHLNSGTCALCGCYVEVRAAVANAICPQVPDKWNK